MRHIIRYLKTFILCLAIFFALQNNSSSEDFEYKLKAEFLERFTRFIDWPTGSVVYEQNIPFDICIRGKNPFGEYLNALARDVRIKNKSVRIRLMAEADEVETCHVLFIANSESSRLAAILEKTSDYPVLTVGDTPGFAQKGVLINFYRSDNYVRFEVNNGAAHRSGLRFSSRLLKLARLVDTTELRQGSPR